MRDVAFLAYLHTVPCAAASLGRCSPGVQAHHVTYGRGLSQKASDAGGALPLCERHHEDLHQGRGVFVDLSREGRREWQFEKAAEAYCAYLSAGARRTGG